MSSKQTENEKTAIDTLNEDLSTGAKYLQSNQKGIIWGVAILVIAVCAVFAYIHLYSTPRNEEAANLLSQYEMNTLGSDSIKAEDQASLELIYNKYGSTDAGNLAAVYLGINAYKAKKYDDAIKYLSDYDTKDDLLAAGVTSLIGDAYVNSNKLDESISYFQKAAKKADSESLSPVFMMKEANVYNSQKKYAEALKIYEDIKANYPKYSIDIDKYIERAKYQSNGSNK